MVVHETARITPQAPQATRAKAIEQKPAKHGETVGSTGGAGTVKVGQDSNRDRDKQGAGTVTGGRDT